MKTLYFFILSILFSISTFAQDICKLQDKGAIIHVNNIRALIHNKGDNFESGIFPSFAVPYKDAKTPSAIYTTGLMFSALDAAGNKRIKAQTYKLNSCGYLPGPWFEGNEQEQYDFSTQWNKIFKVTGVEILTHIEDAKDGVIDNPIPAIFAWPGKGNQYFKNINGFDLFEDTKAGFHEVPGHENGIYEPDFGEYPYVDGLDPESVPGAIFWSVYCTGRTKSEYKNEDIKMQLEIQQTTWAMATDDEILSNTLFTRYYVKNMSNEPYYNYRFGLFVDFDLGCFLDDYIGSFPELNSFYVYNMDNDDSECRDGVWGYGENPPVEVATFLGDNGLDGFYMLPDENEGGTPYLDDEFYNIMNGKWADGIPVTFGGTGYNRVSTDTVDYLFPGDPSDPYGWSMYQENIAIADRKALAISRKKQEPGFVFQPAGSQEYTIAYTYYKKEGEDHLGNVKFAKTQIPLLQNMYDQGLPGAGISKCDCDCLWVGDTDHNGIVNHKDVVNIFKNYGSTGPERKGSIAWVGMNAQDWEGNNYTNVNPKYADVDGNGVIDSIDVYTIKDFIGSTNLCYEADDYYCQEGDDIKMEYEMEKAYLSNFKDVKVNVLIPNEKEFMGIYYEMKFDADIFSVHKTENILKWENYQDINLFYNSYKRPDSVFSVVQFNDKHKNLSIDNDQLLLHIDLFTKRLPKEYPSKYVDVKICNATVYYDDGTEKKLKSQTIHLPLPEGVHVTSNDNTYQDNVEVYPNPVSNTLFVDIDLKNNAKLEIFNLSGQLMLRKNISASHNKLDVQNFKPGIYLLRINNEQINIKKKIVILN